MKEKLTKYALALTMAMLAAQAWAAENPVPVTPDNFPRAESDLFFSGVVKDGGLRQVHASARADADREADRDPDEPRYVLLGGGVRP